MATIIKLKDRAELKKKFDNALKKNTGINIRKFSGIIKLKEDAVLIQKRLRNEW